MSINAHKEGPPRLVIGLGTRAIQISSRRRVAGRLRIPCPVGGYQTGYLSRW